MQDYEKLGAFYLGRVFDPDAGRATDDLLLYDARDLTTHAVIVGMTGSGKTGLGVGLLEEAALDGVPALVVDPKGDLGNLALTFPALRPDDFRPFVDEEDAARRGETADAVAAKTATTWRDGLAQWGQDGERIARLRAAATVTIYTPGSNVGTPLAVLRSFAAPPPAVRADAEALHDRVAAAVSGLLGLLGVDAEPLQSREHILLATILAQAWSAGQDLDLGGLVRAVQTPPVERVGVMDLEAFFPAKERFALAMKLNGLLAAPGFAAWLTGEPLDVGRLLFGDDGRPRVAVVSIAHLSDAERMFVVTLLLGELVAWMRTQPGTSTLRALLYMDEVFGYLPPTANPPSKTPLLTLLKQARAFGLGVVLATQNPVDLDYKALTNAGTWMIGRLQAERDKARLLDGLEGATAAAGKSVDRAWLDRALSSLGPRVFLLHDVHEDAPVLFQTRWTLSWLRGPLSRAQLQRLRTVAPAPPAAGVPTPVAAPVAPATARPVLPPGVDECVLAPPDAWAPDDVRVYRPALLASARLHYVQAKAGVDLWEDVTLLAPAPAEVAGSPWGDARAVHVATGEPVAGAGFAPLPAAVGRAASHTAWKKALAAHLQASRPLVLRTGLGETQQPGESEGAFRGRLAARAREARDAAVAKLRARWTPKLEALRGKLRQAEERARREQAQVGEQTVATAVSVGATVLGALFGRKLGSATNVGRAAGAVRAASRVAREKADAARAQENLAAVEAQLTEAQATFEAEVAALEGTADPAALVLDEVRVAPRKGDLAVTRLALAWVPHRVRPDGREEAGA